MKRILLFIFCSICAVVVVSIGATLIYNKFYGVKFIEEVKYASSITDIDSNLLFAVIKSESNFKSSIVSNKGAVGLMQILPSTAEYVKTIYDVEYSTSHDLYNPQTNIIVGAYYLKYLNQKYNDLSTVLACYNAGEGNVSSWLKDSNYSINGTKINTTPFKQTNHYIEKVLFYLKIYQKSNNV